MQFGERLKKARMALGVTQEKVAADIHVSRQTISSWENERSYPDINALILLSNYYQLSLDILLKEDNGMVEEIKRKEELVKINRVWGISYAINLVLAGLMLISSFIKSENFNMGTGIQVIVIIVMLLNMALLVMVTLEKNKLKNSNKNIWETKSKLIKGLLLLAGLFSAAGIVLIRSDFPQGYHVFGLGTGMLAGGLLFFGIKKFLTRNDQ
ncbi:helix-turn-helix domain-containing protein [Vagococcus elongatus]|nr:helix-turn-helix transcriptional regulator [Vagococcus elongatus]